QMFKGALQPRGKLLLLQDAIGSRLTAREVVAVSRHVRVERDLVPSMAPAPEPVAVARLVDRDPIDPGTETRLTAEPVNSTEDAQENFLRQIQGFVAVAEEVDRELNNHPL